jgi:hypothetical protein
MRLNLPGTSLAFLLLASAASSQQFVERPGTLTGPVMWSECIVPIDVDMDGNLDLFITNAQGYEVPGDFGAPSADPLRPTLLMQTGLNAGVPVFQDQTDPLIPATIVIHGKSSAVVDVDGDGMDDLVIAVAFGDQQRLLRRDPHGWGYLDETSRLPSLVLNSFHVGWGDLDDDGDPDLVFTDAGPNSFSAPGGNARLLLNDGAGFFTEAPLPAVPKIGAQNAKIIDIDGDLDLDIAVDGKSSKTQIYLNDGAANFTLDLDLMPPATLVPGAGAYEVEWGDLDDDNDLDCLYMNWTGVGGFPTTDIAIRNMRSETGSLVLLPQINAISGQNAQDENDFAFLDADNDGDLDVLVAALDFGSPATPEKLFINSGTFGAGFLSQSVGALGNIVDSTLDMAVGDFNNDGRYDVVTATGEIPISPFINRYYENTGPQDTTAPDIKRTKRLPRSIKIDNWLQGFSFRSWIQDSVVDDGMTYVEARLDWTVTKGQNAVQHSADMPHVGGGIHRAVIAGAPVSGTAVGSIVSLSVHAEDPMQNAAQSPAQLFVVCGAERYGPTTTLDLGVPPAANPGGSWDFTISGGPANGVGILVAGLQPASIVLTDGTLLIDPVGARRIPIVFDASGVAQGSVPVSPSANPGQTIYAQSIVPPSAPATATLYSNGIEAVVCE